MFDKGSVVTDKRVASRMADKLSINMVNIYKDTCNSYNISDLLDDECESYYGHVKTLNATLQRNLFFERNKLDLKLEFSHNAYKTSFWRVV